MYSQVHPWKPSHEYSNCHNDYDNHFKDYVVISFLRYLLRATRILTEWLVTLKVIYTGYCISSSLLMLLLIFMALTYASRLRTLPKLVELRKYEVGHEEHK
jgi:hypothetical protein